MDTFPQITKWMDGYERNLSVLKSARDALLSHPLRRAAPELIDAYLCHSLAVIIISYIEHLLESWKEEDPRGILRLYFDTSTNNGAKVTNLFEAFKTSGIDIDRAVFDDYLAIKYLRNAIVHARWKDHEKDWVSQRGFPLDTQKLTKEHWERMLWVNEYMTWYLMAVFLPGLEKIAKRPLEVVPDRPQVLSPDDMVRIIWNNLEAIDSCLRLEFESATTQGRIRGSWESMEGWWDALWDESRKNPGLFAAQRTLVEPALFSWDEYCRLTFEKNRISFSELETARELLREVRAALDLKFLPWPSKRGLNGAALEKRRELLKKILRQGTQINIDAAVQALDIGEDVHRIMINTAPCSLFAIRLPIVDPQRIEEFQMRATYGIHAMEVALLWKNVLEGDDLDLSKLSLLRSIMAKQAPPA